MNGPVGPVFPADQRAAEFVERFCNHDPVQRQFVLLLGKPVVVFVLAYVCKHFRLCKLRAVARAFLRAYYGRVNPQVARATHAGSAKLCVSFWHACALHALFRYATLTQKLGHS